MHPPLLQAHPLCQREVAAFTTCHTEHPLLKFLNACGELEAVMNACFKEEKTLRRQLNVARGPPAMLRMTIRREGAAVEGAAGDAPR